MSKHLLILAIKQTNAMIISKPDSMKQRACWGYLQELWPRDSRNRNNSKMRASWFFTMTSLGNMRKRERDIQTHRKIVIMWVLCILEPRLHNNPEPRCIQDIQYRRKELALGWTHERSILKLCTT